MKYLLSSLLCTCVIFANLHHAKAEQCEGNLLIVLDRSCSMNAKGTPAGEEPVISKWDIAVGAVNKMVVDHSSKVDFGLLLFPDDEGKNCIIDEFHMPIGPGNQSNIETKIANTPPEKDDCATPIYTAMLAARADPGLQSSERAGNILLITDGKETCVSGETKILGLIEELRTHNIKTFVVGFGNLKNINQKRLAKMAISGGTAKTEDPEADPEEVYYQANFQSDLDLALSDIGELVAAGDPEFSICIAPYKGDGGIWPWVDDGGTLHYPEAGLSQNGDGDNGDGDGGDDDGCNCSASSRANGTWITLLLLTLIFRRRKTR